ncbi:hypothetical protein DL96DRAFT_1581795 [Flagelloscypha sp. PMI_526]|nr:hypothetical protein DL96DRAFT_1581795 [Flagelloscypha sp. PMI_526]
MMHLAFKNLGYWATSNIKFILYHTTLYPLLQTISRKPHLSHDEMRHHVDNMGNRSKVVLSSLFVITGFTASTTASTQLPTRAIFSFTMLLWCVINRSYYEGLPFDELQKRVHRSGPALVATLYAVPEIYQVVFIAYQIANLGGWIGIMILASGLLVQILLHTLPYP